MAAGISKTMGECIQMCMQYIDFLVGRRPHVTDAPVLGVDASGDLIFEDSILRTSGDTTSIQVGDTLPILNTRRSLAPGARAVKPAVVLQHHAQRAQPPSPILRRLGLIEELLILPNPSNGGRLDVWFRDASVCLPLGVRSIIGTCPGSVAWGDDQDTFVVVSLQGFQETPGTLAQDTFDDAFSVPPGALTTFSIFRIGRTLGGATASLVRTDTWAGVLKLLSVTSTQDVTQNFLTEWDTLPTVNFYHGAPIAHVFDNAFPLMGAGDPNWTNATLTKALDVIHAAQTIADVFEIGSDGEGQAQAIGRSVTLGPVGQLAIIAGTTELTGTGLNATWDSGGAGYTSSDTLVDAITHEDLFASVSTVDGSGTVTLYQLSDPPRWMPWLGTPSWWVQIAEMIPTAIGVPSAVNRIQFDHAPSPPFATPSGGSGFYLTPREQPTTSPVVHWVISTPTQVAGWVDNLGNLSDGVSIASTFVSPNNRAFVTLEREGAGGEASQSIRVAAVINLSQSAIEWQAGGDGNGTYSRTTDRWLGLIEAFPADGVTVELDCADTSTLSADQGAGPQGGFLPMVSTAVTRSSTLPTQSLGPVPGSIGTLTIVGGPRSESEARHVPADLIDLFVLKWDVSAANRRLWCRYTRTDGQPGRTVIVDGGGAALFALQASVLVTWNETHALWWVANATGGLDVSITDYEHFTSRQVLTVTTTPARLAIIALRLVPGGGLVQIVGNKVDGQVNRVSKEALANLTLSWDEAAGKLTVGPLAAAETLATIPATIGSAIANTDVATVAIHLRQ